MMWDTMSDSYLLPDLRNFTAVEKHPSRRGVEDPFVSTRHRSCGNPPLQRLQLIDLTPENDRSVRMATIVPARTPSAAAIAGYSRPVEQLIAPIKIGCPLDRVSDTVDPQANLVDAFLHHAQWHSGTLASKQRLDGLR